MTVYEYAIAAGWDATVLTNVESIISFAPVGQIVPLGSVRRVTLNQNVQTNGTKTITWHWDALSKADFQYFIQTYLGSNFDTENANVTIQTRGRGDAFERYNAVLILPQPGEDYKRRTNGAVEDLTVTFRDLQPLTGGNGFTIGFSFGFES